MASNFNDPATFTDTVTFTSTTKGVKRADLNQDANQEYPIPFVLWRVWDNLAALLPGTSAADDLEIDGGTFNTDTPHVTTGDVKAAGAITRYARFQFALPAEYEAGETVTLRMSAAVQTTVADTSCTLDAEVFLSDDKASKSGSDLCTTAAIDINSTSFTDKDFTITPGTLNPGDVLDVRVTIACNDAATATVVKPTIGRASILCDIKG